MGLWPLTGNPASMNEKRLCILGIRGIPAAHGGFETFAEHLALYLHERGWQVAVYCQEDAGESIWESEWRGVRRVHVPEPRQGPLGTIFFDWKSTRHVLGQPGLILTLGYNTALFCTLYRLRGRTNLINMDGIEWQRAKWSTPVRAWFWLNERLGCWLGNHLIADHPEIKRHLATRVREDKITMIPYGSDSIAAADPALIKPYGLEPGGYALLIARAEPENSILEVVRAFSRRARSIKLAVLGKYDPTHAYQRQVMESAGLEVKFLGAIYDRAAVSALRFHAQLYIHGHQVGGTNPSLVEALGAGNPVLAHDNPFNRWVAGPAQRYFANEADCAQQLDELVGNNQVMQGMRESSRARHQQAFTWSQVLGAYENLLNQWL